jgi:uncharacterized membrane protein
LGIICALILAAPLLAFQSFFSASSVLYLLFTPICHQIAERSFTLLGYPLAVCHRCSGIYIGMFLGCFFNIHAMHRHGRARRFWVLSALAPIVLDVLAPFAGLWNNTVFSRFSTGLLFGIIISSLVVRGFTEFAHESPWRRLAMQSLQFKGDAS